MEDYIAETGWAVYLRLLRIAFGSDERIFSKSLSSGDRDT